jgi:hypothetical protein
LPLRRAPATLRIVDLVVSPSARGVRFAIRVRLQLTVNR